jgi:hypothetical protein
LKFTVSHLHQFLSNFYSPIPPKVIIFFNELIVVDRSQRTTIFVPFRDRFFSQGIY